MKQIVPNLYLIDDIGDSVHCYAWEWAEGVTLIDAGMPSDAKTILDALARQGWPVHRIKRIIATHGDVDHIGSLAQLKQATKAPVACHVVEKEFLEHPARRMPRPWLMRPLFMLMHYLPTFHVRPVTPDELLVDGQQLPEGFTVVHTPGHSPGHISLLHRQRRILISGDALANRNETLGAPVKNPFSSDIKNTERSVWKLAKKYGDDFDVVVFGHGPPILSNGGHKVKALASQMFAGEV